MPDLAIRPLLDGDLLVIEVAALIVFELVLTLHDADIIADHHIEHTSGKITGV
jgi:hypothetical protein